MDPGVDHVSDWLASPLWCHVADTLHSDKVETVVALDETAVLTVSLPWAPFFLNVPVKLLDPLL